MSGTCVRCTLDGPPTCDGAVVTWLLSWFTCAAVALDSVSDVRHRAACCSVRTGCGLCLRCQTQSCML